LAVVSCETANDFLSDRWPAVDFEAFSFYAADVCVVCGTELSLVRPLDHAVDVIEIGNGVVKPPDDRFLSFAMGLAFGFDFLDVLGLDVLLVDFAVEFPAADVVGSEFLAVVVAVEGVDPPAFWGGVGGMRLAVGSHGFCFTQRRRGRKGSQRPGSVEC